MSDFDDLPADGYYDGGLGENVELPKFKGKGTGKKVDDIRKMTGAIPPGKYHAELIKIDPVNPGQYDPEDQTVLLFSFQAYSGAGLLADGKPYKGPERKITTFVRYLTNDGDVSHQPAVFAYALGLITKEQFEDKYAEYEIDWNEAIGRQCIVQVVPKNRSKTGETMVPALNGVFRFKDPEAKGVPLNVEMLEAGGYKTHKEAPAPAKAPPAKTPTKPRRSVRDL